MAKHPKDPVEAVDSLGIAEGSSVLAVGPDHGFVEALADAVKTGSVTVQAPPPDLEALKSVTVVEEIAGDAKADTVIAWTNLVPVHSARDLGKHVSDQGVLWLVLPRVDRASRAPVTEGDVKKAMLSGGWRDDRVQELSSDSFAVRFRRRR
jgi:hypothetical protein